MPPIRVYICTYLAFASGLAADFRQVFRRFQMSFVSEQDTNAFIASIRGVCPCKMSAAATSNPQRQLHDHAGPVPNFSMQGSQYPYGLAMPDTQLTTGTTIHACPQGYPGSSLNKSTPTVIHTHVPQSSTMPPPPAPSQALRKSSSAPDLDGNDTVSSQAANQSSTPRVTPSSHLSSQTAMSSSQTSASALPISNTNSLSEVEKSAIQAGQGTPPHPLISALQETSPIYSLPLDVLEHVVGDVIREDGFVSLVSNHQLGKLNYLSFSRIPGRKNQPYVENQDSCSQFVIITWST